MSSFSSLPEVPHPEHDTMIKRLISNILFRKNLHEIIGSPLLEDGKHWDLACLKMYTPTME
jgi:hypothetical protein